MSCLCEGVLKFLLILNSLILLCDCSFVSIGVEVPWLPMHCL
ncbi:hypothetical protein Goarm_003264 [Gossypium armourianum]|uniref:Uncharacterized protein n=1 Tax=Gossypium armourianum TaxID=34283 RepID=A0A7J9K2M3_9ROSI|nr:hypothetical protein [Gossypium armourianum]MBA0840699.1 hypothetical protein [Gossypium armourianum]